MTYQNRTVLVTPSFSDAFSGTYTVVGESGQDLLLVKGVCLGCDRHDYQVAMNRRRCVEPA